MDGIKILKHANIYLKTPSKELAILKFNINFKLPFPIWTSQLELRVKPLRWKWTPNLKTCWLLVTNVLDFRARKRMQIEMFIFRGKFVVLELHL